MYDITGNAQVMWGASELTCLLCLECTDPGVQGSPPTRHVALSSACGTRVERSGESGDAHTLLGDGDVIAPVGGLFMDDDYSLKIMG